jgi:hypothetical protein
VAAKAAWEEAVDLWDTVGDEDAKDTQRALASKEEATKNLKVLDEIRASISDSLAELQDADPDLYEYCMDNVGLDAGENPGAEEMSDRTPGTCASWLPNGWEEHVAEDGHPYYHNKVTNLTQWEEPTQDAAECAGWCLMQAQSGMYFYQNPYNPHEFVWWPEMPTHAAAPASAPAALPAVTSPRFAASCSSPGFRDPVLDDGFVGLEDDGVFARGGASSSSGR